MGDGATGKDELMAILDEARAVDTSAGGSRVVFTNGCFDLLHAGHVRYLRQARGLGDLLVVGLNSDASVGRLKPGRPINSQDDRAAVLAALESVDYVCIFDEDTPYELIGSLRPDVLVKGGDWPEDEIVGSDIVSDTRSLSFEEGFSTSDIINRIRSGCSDSSGDWEEVLFTYDSIEADIVRDLLESGGIPTKLASLKVGPYPVNVGRMGEIRLFVPLSDALQARQLISDSSE